MKEKIAAILPQKRTGASRNDGELTMPEKNVTPFNPAARLADETVAKIRAVANSATPAEKKSVQDLIVRADLRAHRLRTGGMG